MQLAAAQARGEELARQLDFARLPYYTQQENLKPWKCIKDVSVREVLVKYPTALLS